MPMIYLFFLVISIIVCAIAIMMVTFTDVYFSGPSSGYSLLTEYLGISKVFFYVILQLVVIYGFRFHESKIRFLVAVVTLISFSLAIFCLK